MIRIGIDPGSESGCVAILANGLTSGWTLLTFKKNDYYEIDRWFKKAKDSAARNHEDLKCVIERVHAMPGQGVSSTAKFMENFGICKGLLISNGIPFKEKTPQSWMKHLPVKKEKKDTRTTWKRKLKQLAAQENPDLTVTNNTADAILIASYLDKIYYE
jgi:hypothetical protein